MDADHREMLLQENHKRYNGPTCQSPKKGKSDKITRLVGEIKNYPHDTGHGDKTQIIFHNKNCSVFFRILRLPAPVLRGHLQAAQEKTFS